MGRFALSIVGCLGAYLGACHHTPPPTAPESTNGEPSHETGCERGRCLEDITKVIQEHRTATRACYDKGLKRAPTIEGRIVINFEIDGNGAVVDASQGMQDNQIT